MSTTDGGDLVFRVLVDDSDLPKATARLNQGMQGMAAGAGKGQQQLQSLTKATALTKQEMLALNYQLSDVAASLASGSSPFTILLQQGGQIKDAFGGVGPLVTKLGGVITPMRVLLGSVAAALGTIAFGFYEGYKRTEEFSRAIVLTGNYAGVTAGQVGTLAAEVAKYSQVSIGTARDVIVSLVKTGQVGPQALLPMAQAVSTLSRVTGQSAEEIVKDFATMSAGVARWAYEHNRLMHFVTAEEFSRIRALEAQGKAQEAMAYTSQLVDKAIKDRQPGLSALGKLWKEVGDFASSAWDKMAGIGKTDTVAQQIDAMQDKLVQVQKELADARRRSAGDTEIGALEAAQKRLEGYLAANKAAGRMGSKEQAEKDAKDQAAVEKQQSAFIDATIARDRAGIAERQSLQDAARERERRAVELQYDRLEINGQTYLQRVIALERAQIDAKDRSIQADIELENRRPVGTPQEALAKDARLLELQSKRNGLLSDRARLEDKIARGELYRKGPEVLEDPRTQFLKGERAQQVAVEQGIRDRQAAQMESSHELIELNRSLNLQLIVDDRARGRAQIDQDEKEWRKRLDLESMSADDRKQAEDSLAQWRLLRERQLTQELQPEYQRQLALFQDTTRYMRQASDEFHQGFIDQGRDMFTQWVTTGKLSAGSLVTYIEQQFAKLVYDRYLAGIFNSLADSFFNSFKAVGGGGGDAGSLLSAGAQLFGLFHTGGVVGQSMSMRAASPGVFAGAPRYHRGGLAGDEVPAILQRGEEVLTARDPRHVRNGGGRSVQVTYAPVINVDSRTDIANVRRIATEVNQLGQQQLLAELSAQGVIA